MTTPYQPFLISQYQTGLFNYLQPWIGPNEAFSPMEDAYVYRGTVQKRNGFYFFGRMAYQDLIKTGSGIKGEYTGTLVNHPIVPGSFTPYDATGVGAAIETFSDNGAGVLTGSAGGTGTIDYTTGAFSLTFNAVVAVGTNIYGVYSPNVASPSPIMGIKQWTNDTDGTFELIAMDTKRASYYSSASGIFKPIGMVSQVIYVTAANAGPITATTGWVAVSPSTSSLTPFAVTLSDGTNTIQDDGAGGFTHNGNALPDGTNFDAGTVINYTTGVITIHFVAASTATITLTARLTGDYFTGNFTNFFNAINWLGQMYMTNNVDRITLFNGLGNTLSRPVFPITQSHQTTYTNDITTCLDLDVYKNRLTIQLPTVVGAGIQAQSIFWSALNNPTNTVQDVAGNGGFLIAPTDDIIRSSEFLRDQLIVFFGTSGWIFRYTGNDFDPFRFDKINNTKSTNAPYGTIPYDERVTAMGNKGLIATDGVNFQRYDAAIVDQFLDINPNSFAQCYGLRFDTLNQSWMLFPSVENDATVSDKVLVYNFIENTWSVYNIAMSCLGLGFVNTDVRWEDFALGTPLGTEFPDWNSCDFPWNEYLDQSGALSLLGGGHDGIIYVMDDGNFDLGDTPSQTTFPASLSTNRWNPFVGVGQKVQFGYIDFYYDIESVTGSVPTSVLNLNFLVDNSLNNSLTRQLWLDGPSYANNAMKRVYINLVGEFLQMEIDSETLTIDYSGVPTSVLPGPFKILGMVLWARPAGRLTP